MCMLLKIVMAREPSVVMATPLSVRLLTIVLRCLSLSVFSCLIFFQALAAAVVAPVSNTAPDSSRKNVVKLPGWAAGVFILQGLFLLVFIGAFVYFTKYRT